MSRGAPRRRQTHRVVWLCSGAVAPVYDLAVAGLYASMRQPPERFGLIIFRVPMPAMIILRFQWLWMSARGGDLRVGDGAPDVVLPAGGGRRGVQHSTT